MGQERGKIEIWNLRLIFLLLFTQLIDLAVSYTVFYYQPNFFINSEWYRNALWIFQHFNNFWQLLVVWWVAPILTIFFLVIKGFYLIKRKMNPIKILTIILEFLFLGIFVFLNFMHILGFLSWIT
jgi:hypothetical protein